MNSTSTQQLVESFTGAIDEIVGAAARGGEYGWSLMVEKQAVDAIIHGGEIIIASLLFAFGVWLGRKAYNYEPEETGLVSDDTASGLWVLCALFTIVSLLAIVTVAQTLAYEIFLPEYAAIEEIINFVK